MAGVSQDIKGYAKDVDGDALTFRVVSGPKWATLSAGGVFSGTADRPDIGENSWVVEVSDGKLVAESTVTVKVIKSNEAPKWLAKPTMLPDGKEDFLYSVDLKEYAADPDGDVMTFTLVSVRRG